MARIPQYAHSESASKPTYRSVGRSGRTNGTLSARNVYSPVLTSQTTASVDSTDNSVDRGTDDRQLESGERDCERLFHDE